MQSIKKIPTILNVADEFNIGVEKLVSFLVLSGFGPNKFTAKSKMTIKMFRAAEKEFGFEGCDIYFEENVKPITGSINAKEAVKAIFACVDTPIKNIVYDVKFNSESESAMRIACQMILSGFALPRPLLEKTRAEKAQEVLRFLFGDQFTQTLSYTIGNDTPDGLYSLEAYLNQSGEKKGFLSYYLRQCQTFIEENSSCPLHTKRHASTLLRDLVNTENKLSDDETIDNAPCGILVKLKETKHDLEKKGKQRTGGGISIPAILRLLKNNNYERLEQIINKIHQRFARKRKQRGVQIELHKLYRYIARAIERKFSSKSYTFQIDKKLNFRRQVRRMFKCLDDVSGEANYFINGNNRRNSIPNPNIIFYGSNNCKTNYC